MEGSHTLHSSHMPPSRLQLSIPAPVLEVHLWTYNDHGHVRGELACDQQCQSAMKSLKRLARRLKKGKSRDGQGPASSLNGTKSASSATNEEALSALQSGRGTLPQPATQQQEPFLLEKTRTELLIPHDFDREPHGLFVLYPVQLMGPRITLPL